MVIINGCHRTTAGLMLLQPFCKFIVKSFFTACGSIDRMLMLAFSIDSVGMITMMVVVVVVVLMGMVNRSGSEPPGPPHVERPAWRQFIP